MYDMSRVMAKGYYDKMTRQQRAQTLEQMSRQRWTDAANARPAAGPRILPEKLDGVTDPVVRMYFDYYRTARGFHKRSPNSNGAWTATGAMPFMNLPLLTYIDEIAPRPILLIAGEGEPTIGRPVVEGARVVAKYVREFRDKKIVIQKFRRRKNMRRRNGHRQYYTSVQITSIVAGA